MATLRRPESGHAWEMKYETRSTSVEMAQVACHSACDHVAQRWELPPAVAEVANRHHDYQGEGRDGYSQLGHVAAAAERLAEHVGLSEDGVCHPLTPDDMSMFYQLGLNEVAIDLAIHEAEKVQEHVRALG